MPYAARWRQSNSTRGARAVCTALVNVDFGPATVLGLGLVGSGVALYQVRAIRPDASRDVDVFFASVGLLCGGILVFQGWRLDPLLLFGQLLTSGAAIYFAAEALQLRSAIAFLDAERASRESPEQPISAANWPQGALKNPRREENAYVPRRVVVDRAASGHNVQQPPLEVYNDMNGQCQQNTHVDLAAGGGGSMAVRRAFQEGWAMSSGTPSCTSIGVSNKGGREGVLELEEEWDVS